MPTYTYEIQGVAFDQDFSAETVTLDNFSTATLTLTPNSGSGPAWLSYSYTGTGDTPTEVEINSPDLNTFITSGFGEVDPQADNYTPSIGQITSQDGLTAYVFIIDDTDIEGRTYVFQIGGDPLDWNTVTEMETLITLNPDVDPITFGEFAPGRVFDFGDFLNTTTTIEGTGASEEIEGYDGTDIIMGGGGNDRIDGDEGDDQLYGEDGIDIIKGGDGADYIDGGAGTIDILIAFGGGADTLVGGEGRDIFIVDGTDTIVDYNPEEGDRAIIIGGPRMEDDFLF